MPSYMPISPLTWKSLSPTLRNELNGKLEGLYNYQSDIEAFDNLGIDKQQALLLIMNRMRELGLWEAVRSIRNVYGEGGVGMSFFAWPILHSMLTRHKEFTTLFASHKDCKGGFWEKRKREAALHFLYRDGSEREWMVHFDLYGPIGSPLSSLKHLYYEGFCKITPDWKMIASKI
jgi:hypothetical protein